MGKETQNGHRSPNSRSLRCFWTLLLFMTSSILFMSAMNNLSNKSKFIAEDGSHKAEIIEELQNMTPELHESSTDISVSEKPQRVFTKHIFQRKVPKERIIKETKSSLAVDQNGSDRVTSVAAVPQSIQDKKRSKSTFKIPELVQRMVNNPSLPLLLPKKVRIKPKHWPAPRIWPAIWSRNTEQMLDGPPKTNNHLILGSSITCNMTHLVESLRPPRPQSFNFSDFHHLPIRYHDNTDPHAHPGCGCNGLLYPWKLVEQQKSNLADGNRAIWMLFVVKSAPGNYENRKIVRNTWGSANGVTKHQIFAMFVVGRTNSENITTHLRKENENYGDILECDFLDSYHMLPIKILSTFRWLLEREFNAEFITMTDDDCLINLGNLTKIFNEKVYKIPQYQKRVFCGYKYNNIGKPIRHGQNPRIEKWAVTGEQYSGSYYPTFCHGGLWTLSRPLMHGIYCVSEITNTGDFFLEDVLLTGILREKLNQRDTNIVEIVKAFPQRENTLLYHAGFHKTAESIDYEAMKDRWKEWQEDWKLMLERK